MSNNIIAQTVALRPGRLAADRFNGKTVELSERNGLEIQLRHKRTRALDAVLPKEDVMRLFQAARDARDRVILAAGLLGLRASEIGALRREWVDLGAAVIDLPSGAVKGGKRRGRGRRVPFGSIRLVAEILTAFFVLEEAVGLDRVSIFRRVKRMARAAGLARPVTVHGLRATAATLFAQAGYSVLALQEHFGWSAIRTAEHYIRASGVSAIEEMKTRGAAIL
jgi:integrase